MAVSVEVKHTHGTAKPEVPERTPLRWSSFATAIDAGAMAIIGGLLASSATGLVLETLSPKMMHAITDPEYLPKIVVGTAVGAVLGGAVGWIVSRRDAANRRLTA